MLSDYVTIDFDAIREKLTDVVFSVAGQAANLVDDTIDTIEAAFYDEQGGETFSFDIETNSLVDPSHIKAGVEPWLRSIK